MAKKTAAPATIEEKMKAALVPAEEQPYAVPENWCWVTTASIVLRLKRGKAPKYVSISSIPVFAQKCNQKDGTIAMEKAQFLDPEMLSKISFDEFLMNEDTVINSTGTGTLGRVGLYKEEYALPYKKVLPDSHVTVVRTFDSISKEYLFFFVKGKQDYLELQGVGTTNQKELRPETIGEIPFPLPPLAEQQRIVDRIKSLFKKLDEAKEKAQTVIDSCEDRKAAILHKAFTGELTAEWRQCNSVGQESWKLLSFADCIDVMQNGIAKRKGESGEPYVVLRLANLCNDGFDETDLREIALDEREQKSYELHTDDVLMIRVNGSKENVGKQYRITNQKQWAFCDHIIRIKYRCSIVPQYMVYFSKSETYRQYIKDNMVSSAGQNTISRKGMARLQIAMPKREEQEQIVFILSNIFEKEQQAKEVAEQVIDQIDTMKKSILSRAFRGELGTNDPNDEPAIKLLERILTEKTG